jgi:adenylate kinase family enzyme
VDFDDVVYIVEGPLDSLFLDNCIASGDANLSIIAKELIDVDKEDKVLIFDNEPRNAEVCKLMHNAIREGHHLVIWPQSIKEKDINEMIVSGYSQREIKSIISKNTFCCIRAFNQLVFWKKV